VLGGVFREGLNNLMRKPGFELGDSLSLDQQAYCQIF